MKQQSEREKKELQAQLEMVTKRDMEHNKQLKSVKEQNVLTMQEVHTCILHVEKLIIVFSPHA